MMAGRRIRDRLVPMSLPRFVPVCLAGAACLLSAIPGRAQTPAPPTTSPVTSSGPSDTPASGRVRVSEVEFTGVSPSVLPALRDALSLRASGVSVMTGRLRLVIFTSW